MYLYFLKEIVEICKFAEKKVRLIMVEYYGIFVKSLL